jgi:hypothetical protein
VAGVRRESSGSPEVTTCGEGSFSFWDRALIVTGMHVRSVEMAGNTSWPAASSPAAGRADCPSALACRGHIGAAGSRRPASCTANAPLVNRCPDRRGDDSPAGKAAIGPCAPSMTRMTSTGVQVVHFGLKHALAYPSSRQPIASVHRDDPGHPSSNDTYFRCATRGVLIGHLSSNLVHN